jgi:pseudouridine-5'-phosphate glycosidase
VQKLSRADLAVCLATGGTGATTVAATMIAAHRAGIAVFATGGIGGVHRGAEESFDISADLRELAETPVTVVAAGAKAILDLPKTLEVLETLGRAGDRGGTGRLPRLLVARQRAEARRSGSTPPRRSRPRTGCAPRSACRAGNWWPTRSRRRPRSPPRCSRP